MQVIIGHDKLFRGCVVKEWHGGNEEHEGFLKLNKVIVKNSVEHCFKCWEQRNEWMNDPDVKRKQLLEWCEKEREQAQNSEYLQVTRHAQRHNENVEERSMEYMQRWLFSLNAMKKNSEKHNRNLIR